MLIRRRVGACLFASSPTPTPPRARDKSGVPEKCPPWPKSGPRQTGTTARNSQASANDPSLTTTPAEPGKRPRAVPPPKPPPETRGATTPAARGPRDLGATGRSGSHQRPSPPTPPLPRGHNWGGITPPRPCAQQPSHNPMPPERVVQRVVRVRSPVGRAKRV